MHNDHPHRDTQKLIELIDRNLAVDPHFYDDPNILDYVVPSGFVVTGGPVVSLHCPQCHHLSFIHENGVCRDCKVYCGWIAVKRT